MIEPLELRIAPATVFPYIDADGDKVTITLSAGSLGVGQVAAGSGFIATLINVTLAAPGANLTVAVTKVAGGDGLANVGYINGTGVDLGTVTVKGDLGKIVCGDGNPDKPAIKTLSVRSMGRLGTATQAPGGDLLSFITGDAGTVKVTGDVEDIYLGVAGKLSTLTIGGSLVGGAATDNGRIFVTSGLSKATIGKNIVGGAGTRAGSIEGQTGITSISVGGSVFGGAGANTGSIASNGDLGSVKIAKDLIGGTGEFSGTVRGGDDDDIRKVTVGGSISGGAGRLSGGIFAGDPSGSGTATLGDVTIGGSVLGAFGEQSGAIFTHGALGAVKIVHDLVGGSGDYSGSVKNRTTGVRSVSIGGSLVGGSGYTSGSIELDNVAGAITVGGSIKGGGSDYTGYIGAGNVVGGIMVRGSIVGPSVDPNGGYIASSGYISIDDAKAITVMGDLVGGSISGTADLTFVGMISAGNVGSILIGGSIFAGIDTTGNGDIDLESGGISVDSAGSIRVKGSIVGNASSRAFITVSGLPPSAQGLALGKLTVGGNVEHTLIEVGTGVRNGTVGAVKVSGDWIASSLASAVNRGNGVYGDGDDALFAGAVSRIASITIGGAITGLKAPGAFFAFTADDIGAFKASGTSFPRTPLINDPVVAFSPETGGNVLLREL